jgi:hypothetical protein
MVAKVSQLSTTNQIVRRRLRVESAQPTAEEEAQLRCDTRCIFLIAGLPAVMVQHRGRGACVMCVAEATLCGDGITEACAAAPLKGSCILRLSAVSQPPPTISPHNLPLPAAV